MHSVEFFNFMHLTLSLAALIIIIYNRCVPGDHNGPVMNMTMLLGQQKTKPWLRAALSNSKSSALNGQSVSLVKEIIPIRSHNSCATSISVELDYCHILQPSME